MNSIRLARYAVIAAIALESVACGETNSATPVLNIDVSKVRLVSPLLYGLMTEEINYSYEGGLYGELIQNRILRDSAKDPVHWSVVQDSGGTSAISLDESQPIDGTVLTEGLKLTAIQASTGHRVGIANDGYWGIPVKPKTTYRAFVLCQVGRRWKRSAHGEHREQRRRKGFRDRAGSGDDRLSGKNIPPR